MKQYRLFFSWQNDRKEIKNIISSALKNVTKTFHTEGIELVIDQDTRGRIGKRNIATEVLSKITSCDIFIADLTPVITLQSSVQGALPKHMPNSNVMYEYGYAQHAIGEEHMIALAYIDSGNDEHIEHMPFDINHDTITTFTDERSLKGLYTWIKKIMGHVDAERANNTPEYACALHIKTENGVTDEETINPRYQRVYYTSGGNHIRQVPTTNTTSNWLDSLNSVKQSFTAIATPVIPTLSVVRKTTNHSFAPIELIFCNEGTAPLDNIGITVVTTDNRVTFAESNVDEAFSLPIIHSTYDTHINDNKVTHQIITINPRCSVELRTIYLHAPHDIQEFTLHWSMNSRYYHAEGNLTIHVSPEYEYETIENENLCDTEEIRDYVVSE